MSALSPSAQARAPRAVGVACMIALLLAVRAALVLSLGEVFFYGEELEKGTAAKALLDGVDWPYHQLAYHPYEGGGFVISHLTALAFTLVGECVLAHKLVALTLGALVLWAGMRLAGRHFGGTSPWFFALLFIFGPASFQKLSLLNLGIHFEACLFLLLAFDATLTLLETSRAQAPPLAPVATLGFALGFGFFFNYQLALVGLWSTLWLLARRPRAFSGRSLGVGVAALVLGLLPLLAMASQVGAQVFDIHGTPLAAVEDNGAKLMAFLRSLFVDRPPAERVSALLYPAAFLLAASWLAWRGEGVRGRQARRVASFLALWFAVYCTSGFVIGEVRHFFQLLRFAPLWVLCTLLLAAALAELRERGEGSGPRLALAAGVLLAGWGWRGTVASISAARPGTWSANWEVLTTTKGYDYAGYFAKVFPRLGDPSLAARALTGFDEQAAALLRADYAQARTERGPQSLDEGLGLLPERSPDYVVGLGALAARLAHKDTRVALTLGDALPEEDRPSWWRAVGRFGQRYTEFPDRMASELGSLPEGPWRREVVRGMGERAYRRFVLGPFGTVRFQLKPADVRAWLATLSEGDREDLLAGFDRAATWHRLAD